MDKNTKAVIAVAGAAAVTTAAIGIAYAMSQPTTTGGGGAPPTGGAGTGIPFTIGVQSYPTNITQLIALMHSGSSSNCLTYKPALQVANNNLTQQGYTQYYANFKVQDAAGQPVPNTPISISCQQSRDDQGGILYINGQERPPGTILKLKSDNNGNITLTFEYHETDPTTIQKLVINSGMACAAFEPGRTVRIGNYSYPGCCGWGWDGVIPWPGRPGYNVQNASTAPKIYIIHLEVTGAPSVQANIQTAAQFNSTCLWGQ